MHFGGDLGLFTATAAAVVVAGLLIVRMKWRRAVARRLEITRLMALASEEAARAELEAATGYEKSYAYASVAAEPVEEEVVLGPGSSPGRQLQYQCEVCFSPTTTRCKQCKAVHYCSGKCQIIHWRQGHKDECRSLSFHQNMDAGAHSCLRDFKLNGKGSINNVTMKPVESSSGEQMFSYPNFHVLSGRNETTDSKGTHMNVEASDNSSNGESSPSISNYMKVVLPNRYNTESISTNMESLKPLLPEQPVLINPDYGIAAPNDQLKSGFLDTDVMSEKASSSSFCTAGSEEHLLSVPSTPSSDFWKGTVESIRTKIEPCNVLADTNIFKPHSSSVSSLSRMKVHAEVLDSDTNQVIIDDPSPSTSVSRKSSDEAVFLEVNKDGLESKGLPILSCGLSNHVTVNNASVECTSKIVEVKMSSPGACCEKKLSEPNVRMQFLAPRQSGNKIVRINDSSNYDEILKNDSQAETATEAQLSSARTRNSVVLALHSLENECGDRVGVAPCQSSGFVQNARSGTNSSPGVMDKLRAPNFIQHGSSEGGAEGSFSYELFVKLYNWNKVELRPSGLVNCGNSCYANVVLQCLSFTPPLTAFFLEGLHSKSCVKKEWCFTCELEMLVQKAKGSYSPVSPARIISQMQSIGRNLGDGKEEDAHEFLRYAIDAMQSVCLKEAGVNAPASLDEETTLMGLTFGGHLRSKIECMRCGGISEQHERIMDLTVEIGGDIGTLEEALHQFTRSEILDGENKYHCGSCKSYEKAKKKLRVLEAPNVLTITLKRFQSGKFGKLNKAIKFPKILNLAPYMSGTTDRTPIYVLYGVIVHLDVMNATYSGHYVCYIKNRQGRWFQADDSTVRTVEVEKVLSKGAYMLLYARCSPRAPRAIRSSMAPPEPRTSTTTTSKFKSRQAESWVASIGKSNYETPNDCFYQKRYMNHHNTVLEDEKWGSENSSSFFSESGSHTSDGSHSSSNHKSTNTDEKLDQILNDMRNYWTSPSDSDTSSQSSSPSPMHVRHSLLADIDRYSSLGSDGDRDGYWVPVLCPDSDREGERIVGSSKSYSENDSE